MMFAVFINVCVLLGFYTIRHCDRILVLDGGRIVEDGSYDALIEKGGFFADLVARQRVDAEA